MTRYREEQILTGAVRYRKGWFGRLIPQVEVRHDFYRASHMPPPNIIGKAAVEAYRRSLYLGHKMSWRDATWQDVTATKKQAQVVQP
jgi:hypothetical protein